MGCLDVVLLRELSVPPVPRQHASVNDFLTSKVDGKERRSDSMGKTDLAMSIIDLAFL